MKSRKIICALLGTLLLLLLGSRLPEMTGSILDNSAMGKPKYAPMTSVKLELGVKPQVDPARMLQRLALERNMQTYPVTEKDTTMTESEIYKAVEDHMNPHVESGFFRWFQDSSRSAEPYLAVDPSDPDNYAVIWAVDFAAQEEPYHNLFLHVDDATGNILMMDYYSDEYLYPPEQQRYCFESWINDFFKPLGLIGTQYVQSLQVRTEEYHSEPDSMTVRYSFQEIQYGLVQVAFTLNPNGFYISISGSP